MTTTVTCIHVLLAAKGGSIEPVEPPRYGPDVPPILEDSKTFIQENHRQGTDRWTHGVQR